MTKSHAFKSANGNAMVAKLIEAGKPYGYTKKLVAAHPMIEFWTADNTHLAGRYYVKTLKDADAGLMIDTANRGYDVDAQTLRAILQALA